MPPYLPANVGLASSASLVDRTAPTPGRDIAFKDHIAAPSKRYDESNTHYDAIYVLPHELISLIHYTSKDIPLSPYLPMLKTVPPPLSPQL